MSRENFKFFTILDGLTLTNENDSGDPEFYGYTGPGGRWVIMKRTVSTGLYAFVQGLDVAPSFGHSNLSTYDTAWTNRASQTYKRPGEFPNL